MEPVEQQRITQSCCALKLANKFVISVSFFSIILPVFLHYSKLHQFQFFTCASQLFCYNNDKNYMFLLCNGILVLIVKNAGLMAAKKNQEDLQELRESKASVAEETVGVQVFEEEQRVEEKSQIVVNEAEYVGSMIIEEESKEQRNEISVIDEDEDDGFGLTAEELNKKCDDFIRKMKEGIKSEARALIKV